MSYFELFKLLIPESILVLTIAVVLGVDLGWLQNRPVARRLSAAVTSLAAGILLAMLWLWLAPQNATLQEGMLVVNPASQFTKQILLALTLATALISLELRFTRHVGEYYAMLLLATLGFMFMVSTQDILMIFVSLELASLSLYILAAFHKQDRLSAEAALKYFLFGGVSAAVMLFGLSLVYGMAGATSLPQIARNLASVGMDPLLIMAMAMITVGLGFKIAAVPFHLWAPDVYQGAPIPSAALIASASKVASFFLLANVMMTGFAGAEGSSAWRGYAAGWMPLLAVTAVLSMALGNLAALAQSSVKRLLAYSAIAHAGYLLVGLLANNAQAWSSVLYYVFTYALTVVGAFGVVTVVAERVGDDQLASFAGLSRRAPGLAVCMLVFMLSLAGIPPLAGFFGKFYLFSAALAASKPRLDLLWLVVFAIAMSAVSLYYYLQVLKQIYVREAPAEARPIHAAPSTQVLIAFLAALVLLLGLFPNLFLNKLIPAL